MSVQKYKLGKVEWVRSEDGYYRAPGWAAFAHDYMTETQLHISDATPLIESETGVLEKLGKADFANTPDEKPWYRDMFVLRSKINELVDAVNALQKGVK